MAGAAETLTAMRGLLGRALLVLVFATLAYTALMMLRIARAPIVLTNLVALTIVVAVAWLIVALLAVLAKRAAGPRVELEKYR